MKIVSLNNHNASTNSINVNFNGTIQGLLDNPAVKAFFSEVSPDDVVTIDGNDTSAISGALGDIEVNDDTVLEVAKFGEAQPQQQAALTTGHVFVSIGGGTASKKILITNGVTTVKQVLTEKLANAFAMTQTQLQAMNIYVNDTSAGLCAVLNDKDNIVLESRKAGSKGAEDAPVYLTVIDADGNENEFEILNEEEPLLQFLDYWLDDDVVEDGMYTVVSVDDTDFDSLSGTVKDAILESPVSHFDSVVIAEEFLPGEEDTEDEEEFTADGTVAPMQPGSVTVSQAGSCQPIKVAITANTTVKDVVTSSKVLNTLAMSEAQILGMRFHINDVEVQAEAQLHNGDAVVISARNCGSKGC